MSSRLIIMLAAVTLPVMACIGEPVNPPSEGYGGPQPPSLVPTTHLHGQVIDLATNEPISGAKVSGGGTMTTTTSDGSYSLQGLRMNVVLLTTTREGYDTLQTQLGLQGGSQVFNPRLRASLEADAIR